MSLIYIPDRKIRADFKPDFPVEIDWNNPLCPKMGLWLPDGRTGRLTNLVTNVANTSHGATADIDKYGRDAYFNGTSNYCATDILSTNLPSKLSFLAIVRGDAAPSTAKAGASPAIKDSFGINWDHINASYTNSFTLNVGGAYPSVKFSTASAGVWYVIGAIWDGATLSVYTNGVLNGSVAAAGSLANADANPFTIGSNSTVSANNYWPGKIAYLYLTSDFIGDAGIKSLSANPYQLLRPKQRSLYVATSSAAVNNLTGTSTESQTVTGSPTIGINMVAASVQQQSGNGAVTVSAQLSGTATATQQANGNLLVSIPLNGATIAQAIATASLAVGNALSGNTQQIQSGTGSLNISITLSGTEIQQAYASGTLTNTAAGAVALVGASDQVQSASGILSIGDNLAGASLAISSATGNLTTLVPLAGATVQAQLASGGITVTAAGVNLSGSDIQQQLATGTLTLRVNLNAQSVQTAMNTGYLTSSGTIVPHPTKWHIKATKRSWKIQATKRTWRIA